MAELDCQACGACCLVSDVLDEEEAEYAHCSSYDMKYRIRPAGLTDLVNIRRPNAANAWGSSKTEWGFLRLKRLHGFGWGCVALKGTPGKRVRCGIYEDRPTVCRRFKPGSASCLGAREELGLTTGAG